MKKDKAADAYSDGGDYAPVNGLNMYYEIHGSGRPLVLLHGALSATGTSFGKLLPALAKTRQTISIEQQAHGHTADIDRPLTIKQMADDTVALLKHIGINEADIFGYSMGAGIALQIAIDHPKLVSRLIVASLAYSNEGFIPRLIKGLESLKPENLAGTPWQEEYARIAPRPEDWPVLVEKVRDMNMRISDWPAEAVSSIKAPALIIIGDSDIVRPEHAVQMFRLLGGGQPIGPSGLPRSRLAILPGTTHVTLMDRAGWIASMIEEFLEVPLPSPS